MQVIKFTYLSIIAMLIVANGACKKSKGPDVENPYNNVKTIDKVGTKDSTVPANSIQGLHRDLFKPTCANSGCHDGTFEPDFRTVASTYYSLVNIKPIKNDIAGTFNARVVPGNDVESMLLYRMTVDLGGNSGIMPLVIDPGSDYATNKQTHLDNLKSWINNGAKNQDGKSPVAVDFPPQILGVQALKGSIIQGRGGKYEPIYTSPGIVDLWFSLEDDNLSQQQLSGMKINWSTDPTIYTVANEKSLSAGAPKTMAGLYNANTEYRWTYTFDASSYKSGDVIWFRITCSDGVNTGYQLPNDNSMFFLKKYFAIKIN